MSELLKRYCPRTEFESYEDMKKNYRCAAPEWFNFAHDVVDEWARLEPEKLALLWTNDNGDMKRYSFADMKRLSDKAANLIASFGIGKGDVVMLILKQRPEAWICITALMKLGAVCIPASYQLTPKDIAYRCNIADVKLLITVDEDVVMTHVKEALPECPTVQTLMSVGDNTPEGFVDFRAELDKAGYAFERRQDIANKDMMLVYFSSGTTGMPKMVWHDYEFPLGHIVTAKYWHCVQENTIHMTQTDSGWAKFAWGKLYGQWICGAAIGAYDTEKFVPHKLLEALQRIKPTTFCAPATVFRYLIKEDLSGYDFSFIRHASLAGEPLNPEVFRKLEEMTGMRVYEGFGQSESSVLLANFPWFEIRPGSMGKPSPLYDIDLADTDGKPCEDGEVGAIVVRNTDKLHPLGLFHGYWCDDETTSNAWSNGVYNTGDMAWRDEDGYFWFAGRTDDIIKSSGYRIGPFEVESAVMTHPAVVECAITGVPDEIRGQVIKATIVLSPQYKDKAGDELARDIQEHVKNVTAPYKYPRIIEFVDELPKTISGKIRRVEIREKNK